MLFDFLLSLCDTWNWLTCSTCNVFYDQVFLLLCQLTVEAVKEKMWKKCGTSVNSMGLELYDEMGAKVSELSDNSRPLGFYSPQDGLVDYTLVVFLFICNGSIMLWEVNKVITNNSACFDLCSASCFALLLLWGTYGCSMLLTSVGSLHSCIYNDIGLINKCHPYAMLVLLNMQEVYGTSGLP